MQPPAVKERSDQARFPWKAKYTAFDWPESGSEYDMVSSLATARMLLLVVGIGARNANLEFGVTADPVPTVTGTWPLAFAMVGTKSTWLFHIIG